VGKRTVKRGRDVNGVLILDKPAGMTSNDALQSVKRIFNAKKAGHTGSLDKPATGVLPICLGEATKFTSYLLNADKKYTALCKLGEMTSTGDAEGEVIASQDVPAFTKQDIDRVMERFTGEIMQVPPMHSALKHKGERLYKLAYQGIEVEREARPVNIFLLKCLDFDSPHFRIEVHCSKGTYIRTLVEDIGKSLGCGAYIKDLVRTAVGEFDADQMITPKKLTEYAEKGTEELDKLLFGVDSIIADMPSVTLQENVSCYLEKGQAVLVPHAPTAGMLKIYNENQDFLGVGEVLDDGRIAPRRLVNLVSS
jgi:tRNA pseudouridine55 synthase